ncbi:Adenylate cyclase, class 3 [Pseudomonas sp. NFPP07]|uniref:nucleotide-binding domain-containing protein n=1 Tax=Pseudomonas TaxID=286 RepID=UPI0008E0CE88|nr:MULTISPECIES: adenylate/guanylate cyclase domain-containing protein [Pseudomonas]AZD07753.1 Putative Adenylate/Guanylate Cyclase [Pseudomonas chlororaphis]SFQ10596.1 Adenylate cyclase, class 3 [Pseudomonas sp. NFPP07]
MRSVKDIYSKVNFSRSIKKSTNFTAIDGTSPIFERTIATESFESVAATVGSDFGIQEQIRQLFGKRGLPNAKIGGHPHFNNLEVEKRQSYGYAVSLFMDIKGSTKLGLIYPPEDVFFIKNVIIKCAIETIQAFDGHVHRIMGDAVLAFFRSDGLSARNSAIDAINCGTYLVEFMRQKVAPELQANDLQEDIGIRVGIDYGTDDNVLWGMYGYPGFSEVTATSFYVDVAAKLQQTAPRNRVMIGNSIKEFLDLHDDVVEQKLITVDNTRQPEPFLLPNYSLDDGKKINYRKYVISHKKYFNLLPKPENASKPISITSSLKAKEGIQSNDEYYACSRSIEKPFGIEFKAHFNLPQPFEEVKVRFRVENYGKDAEEHGGDDRGNHENFVAARQRDDGSYFAKHWENTNYIGLHYMYISVWTNETMYYSEQCFAVYIGPSK